MDKMYEEKHILDIANAIREKGVSGSFKISEMPDAIRQISGGSDRGFVINGGCDYPTDNAINAIVGNDVNIGFKTAVPAQGSLMSTIKFTKTAVVKITIEWAEVEDSSVGVSEAELVYYPYGGNETVIDHVSIYQGSSTTKEYTLNVKLGDTICVRKTNNSGWGTAKSIKIVIN